MQPFKRQSLNDQLMALLVQAIRSGELAPETKLPPEASLAAMFRVSRNTLRETLKTLEVFGIIESRQKKQSGAESMKKGYRTCVKRRFCRAGLDSVRPVAYFWFKGPIFKLIGGAI